MPRVQSRSGQRFAAQGDVIKQILEADGAITALLGAGVLGAAVAPSVAGLIDLATGDTHAFNSGEIPLNGVIANVIPTAGLLTGAAVSAINPDVRAILDISRATDGDPEANARAQALLKDPRHQELIDRIKLQGLSPEESQKAFMRQSYMGRGSRNLVGGMLIGTLASAFPAMALMRDQPSDAQAAS